MNRFVDKVRDKMSDPFLEREKELMKLNESLNSKMSFDLKAPKTCNAKTTNNKIKKPSSANRSVKSDANQPKNGIKDVNKLSTDSCAAAKKPFTNTYTTEKLCEKYELEPKDNAFNRNNNNNAINDDTNQICNEIKRTIDEQINGEHTMCDTLIETIEKAIDTKPSTTHATQLSLIPGNVFRKNASADGIIK